jgi:hypothetical protein
MTDRELVELAFDLLDEAEVMQEFDDSVWIRISKEDWETFHRESSK